MRKREDGYHDIASLFTAVSLGDTLSLRFSDRDSFVSNQEGLKEDPSNSVLKARDLFRERSGFKDRIAINLIKNIPVKAGLGGGSSNAATTLFALNTLFDSPYTLEDLILMGSRIGSDIPFFFSSGLAYCRGRGEILEEVNVPYKKSLWIAKPNQFELGTPSVYKECLPSEATSLDPATLLQEILETDRGYINDLEPAATRLLPHMRFFKEELLALGFETVCMTGSGTAFFCFGNIDAPYHDAIIFYPVETIRREEHSWYLSQEHACDIF